MKQNFFLGRYKIQRLKCKIPKFEMSRVKLNDFTSAESWTILTRKMVVHVTTSADIMLGTIWRIMRKRRLEEGDNALLAPLTMKVGKTKGLRMRQLPS